MRIYEAVETSIAEDVENGFTSGYCQVLPGKIHKEGMINAARTIAVETVARVLRIDRGELWDQYQEQAREASVSDRVRSS